MDSGAECCWGSKPLDKKTTLIASEAQYRTLFDSIGSGFCIVEMKFDAQGRAIDYMIVEGNAAFEDMTGLKNANGKWVSEIAPGLERHWFDTYGSVALTGEPVRFENRADIFSRWYDVQASRVGDPADQRVAILFNDITARKQLEGRQAALIVLNDALRDLTDVGDIAYESSRVLGEVLGVDRVGYGIVDLVAETITIERDFHPTGTASLAGTVKFRDYGSFIDQVRQGEPVVVNDVAIDSRTRGALAALDQIGVAATVNMPVVEQGRTVALIYLGHATQRVWSDHELALTREFAQQVRFAVERARVTTALSESGHELQRLTDNLPLLVAFVGADLRYRFANAAYLDWFGVEPETLTGTPVVDLVGEAAFKVLKPKLDRALAGERLSSEQYAPYARGGGRQTRTEFIPRRDAAGVIDGFYATIQDISERREVEIRQEVLVELNDAVRDLTDPAEIAQAASRILAEALNVSRVGYGVMDTVAETITIERDYNAPGVRSIAGVIHFRDFGSYIEDLARGEAVIFADAAKDPRINDGGEALAGISATALINLPLIERGEVVALLFVNNATPRPWSDGDIALVREVAERVRTATERARATAELRDSEERYRTLFNTIDEGFCIIEFIDGPHGPMSDYVHLDANPAAAEQVGLTDVKGRTIREIAGDGAQPWIDVYSEVLRTGDPIRFEQEFEETGRWLELAAFRVEPASRNHVAVVFKDLTARKSAEMALRESEAQFRAFSEAVPNHVWASRPDGDLYWFNSQVYAYTGMAEGALNGAAAWADIVHPDDLPSAAEAWTNALSTGDRYHTEFRIRRADGEWRWFVVRAEPVRDANGEIIRWVGANIDIEDIRRQGEELDQVNETLSALLAGSKAERDQLWTLSEDMLARADYEGGLSAVNPAWTKVLGWTERELLTNPYADIIHPDDVPATVAALEMMGETGRPTRFENLILSKDGAWTPIGWTVSPEPDGLNFIAVGRDLTADKAREQQLARAEEALRQSQKMEAVGQLTGGIAHDFNNLLAGISGSLELIEKRMGEGRLSGIERYISAAQGAARRAAALTQRLLAFSRRQTLDPKPTDVNRLIAGMEDLIRRSVGPDVQVEVVGAGGLWTTRIDPSQLENALLNLCINSRDAMAPDGGRLTIETANKWLDDRAARERDLPPGQYISLCVTDTGCGMPPDIQAQAFDPFFTTKPIGQGTGLGLSMIHGFVRQSGGQVRIYSEVGRGTTMCLYLPRHTGEAETGDAAPAAIAAEGGHGETVLVVDDEPTVRMLVVEVLEEAGYIAMEAADGPAGLAILRSDARIDLLITDVGLPGGMNGRQVADAARQTRPDLKVLFITGYAENAAVGDGHLEPGMEVITKPFAMAVLGAKVREMIEG